MIEPTEATIYPIKNPKPGSTLRAFAQVTLNEEFVVKSIRIVEGSKGLFVGFPQTPDKQKEGEYHDLAFPITKECRNRISDFILEKYAETAEDGYQPSGNSGGDQSPPKDDDNDW